MESLTVCPVMHQYPPVNPWRLALGTGMQLMRFLPCFSAVSHSILLTLPYRSRPRASQLQLLLSLLQEAEEKPFDDGNYGRQNSSDCAGNVSLREAHTQLAALCCKAEGNLQVQFLVQNQRKSEVLLGRPCLTS